MKKTLLSLVLLLGSLAIMAQENPDSVSVRKRVVKIRSGANKALEVVVESPDSSGTKKITVLNGGEAFDDDSLTLEFPKKSHRKKGRRSIDKSSFYFDFGWNALMNKGDFAPSSNSPLELNYFKSSGINLGWNRSFGLIASRLRFSTGIGLESNNFRFRNPITLGRAGGLTTFTTDTNVTFSKNKLTLTYINIPLLLEFRSNPWNQDKSFNISAGIEFAYLLQSYTKQVYEQGDITQYRKTFDNRDFNLEPFKASLMARAGYGNFSVFCRYGLTSMFRNTSVNPDVQSFMAGVSIIGFY